MLFSEINMSSVFLLLRGLVICILEYFGETGGLKTANLVILSSTVALILLLATTSARSHSTNTSFASLVTPLLLQKDMDRAFRDVVRRSISLSHLRSSPKPATASDIRKTFIDYFCKEHEHLYIRSSPVFSLKDPTLAFTNAGMNQFKDVFLGLVEPASSRVANSQKCIRIGGAHNDLEQVGQDGSHHTFFEMLGNWSFSDYFKEDACRMSWKLLTEVYRIPPERLYVTYFGGDVTLGLSPDVEVQEIWRQIGVMDSNILAFGAKHNFWSGSTTGPCGPCTEIHYDHRDGRTDARDLVNSGSDEVTELWNLVFTQFDRKQDGKLVNLKKHFVDTGMGLERLVAVLQGKTSNYDTDLFLPLFEVIEKQTGHSGYTGQYGGNAADCAYRVLADHSRMIAVALGDGMLPNHQSKVKGIMRKSFRVAEKIFRAKPDLLKELTNHVAEILSDAYPEIGRNLSKIHYIIDSEAEVLKLSNEKALNQWQKMKKTYPALKSINIEEASQILGGLEYFNKNRLSDRKKPALTGKDIFTLYDTYGVPVHLTEQMALKLGIGFDMGAYIDYESSKKASDKEYLHKKYIDDRHEASYLDILAKLEEKKIQPTLDHFKHDYRVDESGKYIFNHQEATIEGIISGNELLDEISAEEIKDNQEIGLILDRTQLFSEADNQACDCGWLSIGKDIIFDIKKLIKIKNFVIHLGAFRKFPSSSKVRIQDLGILHLDEDRRLSLMRNHTSLHLVNAFLRDELYLVGEKFSKVTPEKMLLGFMFYRKNLNVTEGVQKLEKFMKYFISNGVSVERKILNHPQFQALDNVIFVPGENILNREIPVIEINGSSKLSREYCTGTHLLNTSHLNDFVVTNFQKGSNRTQIEAVAGEKCVQIRKRDSEIQEKWSYLKNEISDASHLVTAQITDLGERLKQFFAEVANSNDTSHVVRYTISEEVIQARKELFPLQKESIRNLLRKEIIKASTETSEKFVVHCLERSWKFDPEDLRTAAEGFTKPLLMVLKCGDSISIQCIIPQNLTSERFTARDWLLNSAVGLGGIAKTPHLSEIAFLRDAKATQPHIDQIMKTAIRVAKAHL